MSALMQITFDAAEPRAVGSFWATALGYVEDSPPPGFDDWDTFADSIGMTAEERTSIYAVVDPEGKGPRVLFLRVPEAKTAKNRVHIDVLPPAGDDRATHVARLVEAGGSVVGEVTEHGGTWTVMTDPEGNEFCVVGE